MENFVRGEARGQTWETPGSGASCVPLFGAFIPSQSIKPQSSLCKGLNLNYEKKLKKAPKVKRNCVTNGKPMLCIQSERPNRTLCHESRARMPIGTACNEDGPV